MALSDIAFPYRANRQFGAASFALIFLMLVAEIEAIVAVIAAATGHFDSFLSLQSTIFPAAILVSLAAAIVFTFRARAWTRKRLRSITDYGAGTFGDRLALRTRG